MSAINREIVRRLVATAYDRGWVDACHDHLQQKSDSSHPVGASRARGADEILTWLDPIDITGLRGGAS